MCSRVLRLSFTAFDLIWGYFPNWERVILKAMNQCGGANGERQEFILWKGGRQTRNMSEIRGGETETEFTTESFVTKCGKEIRIYCFALC